MRTRAVEVLVMYLGSNWHTTYIHGFVDHIDTQLGAMLQS